MRAPIPALLLGAALLTAAPAHAQPDFWLTWGGQATLTTGRLGSILGTEGSVVVGGGINLLQLGSVHLGADAEGTAGRVSANLLTVEDEKITVYRLRLGVRAFWWAEDEEPRLVPFVRGGVLYRHDRGALIRDDGFGWYVGAGVDYRVSDAWSIGPFVNFDAVSMSIETRTFLFGLAVSYGF